MSKFTVHVLLTTASYPDCALTGTLPHGPRDYYGMRYAIRNGSRECVSSSVCVLMMGPDYGWDFGEGSNFQ